MTPVFQTSSSFRMSPVMVTCGVTSIGGGGGGLSQDKFIGDGDTLITAKEESDEEVDVQDYFFQYVIVKFCLFMLANHVN